LFSTTLALAASLDLPASSEFMKTIAPRASFGFRHRSFAMMSLISTALHASPAASAKSRNATRLLLSIFFAGGVALPAASQAELVKSSGSSRSEIRLADVNLVDKEGHGIAFAREAVADRIVVINFVYSKCRTLCPLTSAMFKALQDRLGARLGKDVWLLSITLDPAADTPLRLKEFADQFEPNPGWLWLTGKATDIESVLNGLGASSANVKEHAPLTLIGDGKYGVWTQLNVLPSPARIETELERLWVARRDRAPTDHGLSAQ
jgi:protein SCO1/2